jgi:betaine-aldehyde dehydrogenase
MVYKPSEFTPMHANLLAEIYTEAGLPPGVFNVVHGDGKVGAQLTSNPNIAKVSFTGQVSTGMKVAGSAGSNLQYATMELGGKSPLIMLPDAEVKDFVKVAMMANFYSSGQVCTNGTRVFVPDIKHDAFLRALKNEMPHIRAGNLMDPSTNFGPLSSSVHRDKVISYIKHGVEVDRATLLVGGPGKPQFSNDTPAEYSNGYWVQPTVFTDCTDEMRIVKEEIFGPVMTILKYRTIPEAIQRANNTALGLAAGVFTKDINLGHKVVAELQAGICWINSWGDSPAEMSVGGWKKSGLGVENGRKGLEAWTRNKSTLVNTIGHDKYESVFAKL